jgi:hypothetical protein
MTVRNRTIRGRVSSEHIVQFFDTDDSRAHNVAAFLAQGHAAGEPTVVIARPMNWTAIAACLGRLGVPVPDAIATGALVVQDADDTLRRLSRTGSPDRTLFESVVAEPVTALAARGRVRAYGEMVDILAQQGELQDAVRLEGFWNELSERVPLFLMCGYSAAHFVSTSTHRALLDICRSHSGVHRDVQDPLGNWLLTAAHNGGPAAGSTLRH